MKYVIDFDNNKIEKYAEDLRFLFAWAQSNREMEDYAHSAMDIGAFDRELGMLGDLFGVKTSCRIKWDENGDPEIRSALIGERYIVYNGELDRKALYDALWEIAHGKKA